MDESAYIMEMSPLAYGIGKIGNISQRSATEYFLFLNSMVPSIIVKLNNYSIVVCLN